MVAVLISNEITNVCVKVNKVEATDFTYNLTFRKDNPHLFTLLTRLKGASFNVLNDVSDYTIIALPLEGWNCTELSEDDYKQISLFSKIERNAELLRSILNYENVALISSRYLLVSYEDEKGVITNNLIIKVKCTKVNSGIITNITICHDENEYFVKQGMKVTNIIKKYLTIDQIYIGLAKLLMYEYASKPIQSIDEIISPNVEF